MLIDLENNAVQSPMERRAERSSRSAFCAGLYNLWTSFHRWNSHRLAIVELQRFEGRMLKDIGLHRSGIEFAVNGHQGWPQGDLQAAATPAVNHSRSSEKRRNGDAQPHV
jgi:uncharacterized protein YjiS (DUF1127 family)